MKSQPGKFSYEILFKPECFYSQSVGQTLFPLIDIQPVFSNPFTPLKGLGLDIKKNENFGVYLKFILNSYSPLSNAI